MKKLAYGVLKIVACLGTAVVIMLAIPAAAIPLGAGIGLGYLLGQTITEIRRANHDQSGIYGRMDAYRDKDN